MSSKDISNLTLHPLETALDGLSVDEKLVNGTELLLLYYGLVIIFFILDIYIDYKTRDTDKIDLKTLSPIKRSIAQLYIYYKKYGYLAINFIVLVICDSIIFFNIGFEYHLILNITISIILFSIFMKVVLRIFINRKNYENDTTIRLVNTICYIILGNFFCYNMSFISAPNLLVCLSGLTLALLFCIYIMLVAIFNPEILQKSTKSNAAYSQAFGILKGMIVVLICMLTTLFMMVYCCYKTSPGFYATTSNAVFNEWDLLYYLIISFTTIGYGDIVPLRFNNMFFSRYVAIVIGLSSMFTTTCFVAAVISTTNSLAQAYREKSEEEKNTKENNSSFLANIAPNLTEERFTRILNDTLKKYSVNLDDKKNE